MCEEYTYRYGKIHASRKNLERENHLKRLPMYTERTSTMYAEECKVEGDAILAYRQYYKKYKIGFSRPQDYLKRERPIWLD